MASGVFFPSASARPPRGAPGRPRRRARRALVFLSRPWRGRCRAGSRFEAGEQTPLPFVEQAGEQDDGGAQLGGHQLGIGQGPYESGRGQQQAPGLQLPCLLRAVDRAVEELAGELVPRQAPVADELAQRVLGADMEQVVELLAEMPCLCLVDERLGGGDQGADAGEADAAERPQSELVEVGEFVEGVVAAAMRVAGARGEVLELAERGAPGAGSERRHDLGQRGDGLLAEQGEDCVGGELGWSHSGTITAIDCVMMPEPGAGRHPKTRRTAYFLRTARQEILAGDESDFSSYYRRLQGLILAQSLAQPSTSRRAGMRAITRHEYRPSASDSSAAFRLSKQPQVPPAASSSSS